MEVPSHPLCMVPIRDVLGRAVAKTPVLGPLMGRALRNVRLGVVSSVGRSGRVAAVLLFSK